MVALGILDQHPGKRCFLNNVGHGDRDPFTTAKQVSPSGLGSSTEQVKPDWRDRPEDSPAGLSNSLPGGYSERVPPDPIPNSEVKTLCADDSVAASHAKVGHCQALKQNP